MLPAFFEVVTEAYLLHGEPYTDEEVAGAALWARPGTDPVGADAGYAERLEAIVGDDAPRMFELIELLEGHAPRDAHYHLQFLAVLPQRQGAGVGGRLMAPVLARCDRDAVPAYLEATSKRNRALYERHGFRTTGELPLRDGPSLWTMWRDPLARRPTDVTSPAQHRVTSRGCDGAHPGPGGAARR
jgi:GNAT superfamily N-acetyltransferase